ncbi:hypothetical protein EON62_04300, partial [archaeon]
VAELESHAAALADSIKTAVEVADVPPKAPKDSPKGVENDTRYTTTIQPSITKATNCRGLAVKRSDAGYDVRNNEPQSDAITNERFRAAIALTVGEFMDTVLGYIKYWLPARDIVREALDSASTVRGCP